MGGRQIRYWPLILASALVCAVGAAVSGFFGLIAYGMYGGKAHALGAVLGAGAGLVAVAPWCFTIGRLAVRQIAAGGRLRWGLCLGIGTLGGLLAGVLATIILHLTIWLLLWRVKFPFLGFGLIAGGIAGTLSGLVCAPIIAVGAVLAVRRPPVSSDQGG